MKKGFGIVMVLALLLALALPALAAGEAEVYYPLEETQEGELWRYACKGISFTSSVREGERSYKPVTLVAEAGVSVWLGAEEAVPTEETGEQKTYVFETSGTYKLTLRGEAAEDTVPYTSFGFRATLANAAAEPTQREEAPQGTVYPLGTGSYTTQVTDGETRSEAAVVYFTEDITCTYSIDGAGPYAYGSGARLGGWGSYVLTLEGKDEYGQPVRAALRFTLAKAAEPVPELQEETPLLPAAPSQEELVSFAAEIDSDEGEETGWEASPDLPEGDWNAPDREELPPVDEGESWNRPAGETAGETAGDAESGKPETEDGEPEPIGAEDADVLAERTEDGETILEVSLDESYFVEFDQYSERLGASSFFTNVANGGLTQNPVWFELPPGMTGLLRRADGWEAAVENGLAYEQAGTYTLSVEETVGNVRYRGAFSFRILPPETASGGAAAGQAPDAMTLYFCTGASLYVDEQTGVYTYTNEAGFSESQTSAAALAGARYERKDTVCRYRQMDYGVAGMPHYCVPDEALMFYQNTGTGEYYYLFRDGTLYGPEDFSSAGTRMDTALAERYAAAFLSAEAEPQPGSDPALDWEYDPGYGFEYDWGLEPGYGAGETGETGGEPLPGTETTPETGGEAFDWSTLEDYDEFQYYDSLSEEELLRLLESSMEEDADYQYEVTFDWREEEAPASWLLTYTGIDQAYDREAEQFRQTTNAGGVFYSNVPNGAVTNTPVYLSFTQELSFRMYKDGEVYEYTRGETLYEPGEYCLVFEVVSAEAIMKGYSVPRFSFRLVTDKVREMELVYPPYGYELTSAELDGEKLRMDTVYATLGQDGDYSFSFRGLEGEPSYSLRFAVDSEPPQFRLTGVTNGVGKSTGVSVQYLSEDATRTEVYVNGNLTGYTGSITDVGNIEVRVYDAAGNYNSERFTIKLKLNFAAALAVLLLLALLAAGVYFFRYARRKLPVR